MLFLERLQDFFHQGGSVLLVLFFTIALLIYLALKKALFIFLDFPALSKSAEQTWSRVKYATKNEKEFLHRYLISDLNMNLDKGMSLFKTLIALCPLLGLLGTVTGMIQVFDVMSFFGTGNAKLMSSGISKATIPTMVGMIGSLVGIYFNSVLENKIKKKKQFVLAAAETKGE